MGGSISSIGAIGNLPPDFQGSFGKGSLIRSIANPAASVVAQPQEIRNVEAASRDSRGYADVPREQTRIVQPIVIDDVLPQRKRRRRHIGII